MIDLITGDGGDPYCPSCSHFCKNRFKCDFDESKCIGYEEDVDLRHGFEELKNDPRFKL